MKHNEGGANVSWDVGTGEVIEKPPAHLVGSRVPRDRRRAGRASLPGFAISSGESEMATAKKTKVALEVLFALAAAGETTTGASSLRRAVGTVPAAEET